MADIRGISGVQAADLSSAKVRHGGKVRSGTEISDRVEVSPATAKAIEIAQISELAKSSPDIRMDKVKQAQARIANGDYFKPEVTQAIAEKILETI